MQRTIKFRAWDNKRREYHDYEKDDKILSVEFNGVISAYTDDDGGKNGLHEHAITVEKGRYILEQFTGLYDREGVEIYEGDIVNDSGRLGIVAYGSVERKDISGVYYLLFDVDKTSQMRGLFTLPIKVKVIGNIHLNPELLSTEEEGEKK